MEQAKQVVSRVYIVTMENKYGDFYNRAFTGFHSALEDTMWEISESFSKYSDDEMNQAREALENDGFWESDTKELYRIDETTLIS